MKNPFQLLLSNNGLSMKTQNADTANAMSVPSQIPATGNSKPARKPYITILVDANSMILPNPRAKAGPAVRVRMTMDESITAGNVEKMPVQNADPYWAILTENPTTLPANIARISICVQV